MPLENVDYSEVWQPGILSLFVSMVTHLYFSETAQWCLAIKRVSVNRTFSDLALKTFHNGWGQNKVTYEKRLQIKQL